MEEIGIQAVGFASNVNPRAKPDAQRLGAEAGGEIQSRLRPGLVVREFFLIPRDAAVGIVLHAGADCPECGAGECRKTGFHHFHAVFAHFERFAGGASQFSRSPGYRGDGGVDSHLQRRLLPGKAAFFCFKGGEGGAEAGGWGGIT